MQGFSCRQATFFYCFQNSAHVATAQRREAVGEDLDALDEAGGVGRGRGQRVGAVRVPDAEGDLDGLGVDEGRAAGQRDAADPRATAATLEPWAHPGPRLWGRMSSGSWGSTARHAAP